MPASRVRSTWTRTRVDLRLRGSGGAMSSTGRGLETTEQRGDRGAPGVGVGAKPSGRTLLREPGGLGGGREALQEAEADRALKVDEEADGAREDDLEMGAQLVGGGDAGGHEVLAAAHRGAQRDGRRRIGLQRGPAVAVGAQAIGEDEGIAAIVLVAGQPVAGAQRLHGTAGDDHDLEAGVHEGFDDGAVGPFDGDAMDTGAQEAATQGRQPRALVGHVQLVDHLPIPIDHACAVLLAGSVDTAEANGGILHPCLLAIGPVGKHPVVPGRDSRWLTDRRSQTLSPKAGRHDLGHRSSHNSRWPSRGELLRRWTGGHQGCIASLVADGMPIQCGPDVSSTVSTESTDRLLRTSLSSSLMSAPQRVHQ